MNISATLNIFLISDDSESGQHFQRPQDLYSFISYCFTELVQLTSRCLGKLSSSRSLSPHLCKLRRYNFLHRWEGQWDNVEGSASHITGARTKETLKEQMSFREKKLWDTHTLKWDRNSFYSFKFPFTERKREKRSWLGL